MLGRLLTLAVGVSLGLGLVGAAPAEARPVRYKVHVLVPPELPMTATAGLVYGGLTGDEGDLAEAILVALADRRRGLGPLSGIGTDDAVLAWPDALPVAPLPPGIVLPAVPNEGRLPAATVRALSEALGMVAVVTGETGPVESTPTDRTQYITRTRAGGGSEQLPVPCVGRFMTRRARLVLLDVQEGRAIVQELTASTDEEQCADSPGSSIGLYAFLPDDGEAQIARTNAALALQVANLVAPRWTTLTLKLEATRHTRRAIAQLKEHSDRVGATDSVLRVAADRPEHAAARYSAAVFLAVAGRFEAARAHLRAARDLKDKELYSRFADTLGQLELWFLELRVLGVPMEPAPISQPE